MSSPAPAALTELLARLEALDVRLALDGERLTVNAPKGALTEPLRAELGARKPELIAHLRTRDATEATVPRTTTRAATPKAVPDLVPVPRESRMPVAHTQQRLWFLRQMDPTSGTYNVGCAFHMRGPLDVAVFERTLAELVQRHESLRTQFVALDGTPWCVVEPEVRVPLRRPDLGALPDGGGSIVDDQPFSSFGLDSLTSVELRNRLQAAVGRPVPATAAFEWPTTIALATELASYFPDAAPAHDAVSREELTL